MKIEIEITGIVGLLVNRFTDLAAETSTGGSRGSSGAADRGTPQEICEDLLHKDERGRPIMPSPNIMNTIVAGGQYHKIGKRQVTTQRGSLLFAAVTIDQEYVPIEHEAPWKVDTRPVRIPSTGGRILRHRPCFDDWRLRFTVDLDVTIINAKLFRMIVDDAGKRSGLGDYRPSSRGPYGRFVVASWRELSDRPIVTPTKAPKSKERALEPA